MGSCITHKSNVLWAVLMKCYKQCGLADHSVVENVNKFQILSFSLYYISANCHPK